MARKPNEKEIAYMSMTQLASLIEKKELSVSEMLQVYLNRTEHLNPTLNAYITICADDAIATAKKIDQSLSRGGKMTPLLGMPIPLKDQFDTAGVLTTFGSKSGYDNIPKEDSTVVAKLKEAGAIIFGKLNMSEFACGGGEDQPYGEARNPWNTAYSPAGSSSGSGIAVAAGMCAAAMGEDTGGSGRAPANVCGVVGYRPSHGLVSGYGVQPLTPSIDSATTMSRTVKDSAIILQAIAGWDLKHPLSSVRPVPNYIAGLEGGVKRMRVGVVQELINHKKLDPEVKAAIQEAIDTLTRLGASVDEASIPHVAMGFTPVYIAAMAEGAALNQRLLSTRPELFRKSTRLNLLTGSILPSKLYTLARQAQTLIRNETMAALERCDVLVCPVSATLPTAIEEQKKAALVTAKEQLASRYVEMGGFTGFSAGSGTPAISVPCGFSRSGLPIGLQIVGRPFEDATVLRVAHTYEQSTDWHTRHPDL